MHVFFFSFFVSGIFLIHFRIMASADHLDKLKKKKMFFNPSKGTSQSDGDPRAKKSKLAMSHSESEWYRKTSKDVDMDAEFRRLMVIIILTRKVNDTAFISPDIMHMKAISYVLRD